MHKTKNIAVFRFLTFILALLLLVPLGIPAKAIETQPRASAYLAAYSAYTSALGNGKVRVYFEVSGTSYMDTIGASSIQLYESSDNSTWRLVKTFSSGVYASMLANSTDYHAGHVEYPGTAGRYYKAYVCAWASKNGSGDSRYFWTSAVRAS